MNRKRPEVVESAILKQKNNLHPPGEVGDCGYDWYYLRNSGYPQSECEIYMKDIHGEGSISRAIRELAVFEAQEELHKISMKTYQSHGEKLLLEKYFTKLSENPEKLFKQLSDEYMMQHGDPDEGKPDPITKYALMWAYA